jgi:cardiolipin synthase (CMP-forming)
MLTWPPRKYDIPNILTVSRLILLPFMIILFLIHAPWAAWTALVLYTVACISDFLDGYYARLYGHTSRMGSFLDPIADKLFVGAVLFMLVATERLNEWWAVPALLIMMREIFIAGLREFLASDNIKMPVSRLAKWKTSVQMVAIGFLIMWPYVSPPWGPGWFGFLIEWIGKLGLMGAMVLTLKTGWDYVRVCWPNIRD